MGCVTRWRSSIADLTHSRMPRRSGCERRWACDSPRPTRCASCASFPRSCRALATTTFSKRSAARAMVSVERSFAEHWDRQARVRGGHLALSDHRRSLTWHQAADVSRQLARGLLALGAQPGEVVGCWLPNCPELYLLRIACERAGLIWLPIAASLREWELHNILDRVAPAALIIPDRLRDRDYAAAAQSLLRSLGTPPRLVVLGGPPAGSGISFDALAQLGNQPSARTLLERPAD